MRDYPIIKDSIRHIEELIDRYSKDFFTKILNDFPIANIDVSIDSTYDSFYMWDVLSSIYVGITFNYPIQSNDLKILKDRIDKHLNTECRKVIYEISYRDISNRMFIRITDSRSIVSYIMNVCCNHNIKAKCEFLRSLDF